MTLRGTRAGKGHPIERLIIIGGRHLERLFDLLFDFHHLEGLFGLLFDFHRL